MVSLGRCTLQYPFHKQSLPVCLSVCLSVSIPVWRHSGRSEWSYNRVRVHGATNERWSGCSLEPTRADAVTLPVPAKHSSTLPGHQRQGCLPITRAHHPGNGNTWIAAAKRKATINAHPTLYEHGIRELTRGVR
jgi:hypothetical protein